MNEFEQMLTGALEKSVNEQYGKFFCIDKKHKFSHTYKKQRRRNILSAEKTRKGLPIPPAPRIAIPKLRGIPLKSRISIIAAVVFLAAVGISSVGASVSVGLKKVDENNIRFELGVADVQNSPQSIENVYYLSEIPDGYYLDKIEYDFHFDVQYFYKSYDSDDFICFFQSRRQDNTKFDNEHILSMEDVMVEEMHGIFMTWEKTSHLLWDNGDYVFHIFGSLTKEETMDLAKSTKVFEDTEKFKQMVS